MAAPYNPPIDIIYALAIERRFNQQYIRGWHVRGEDKNRECRIFRTFEEDCQTMGCIPRAVDIKISQSVACFTSGSHHRLLVERYQERRDQHRLGAARNLKDQGRNICIADGCVVTESPAV